MSGSTYSTGGPRKGKLQGSGSVARGERGDTDAKRWGTRGRQRHTGGAPEVAPRQSATEGSGGQARTALLRVRERVVQRRRHQTAAWAARKAEVRG